MTFTDKKFLRLSKASQHKKICELIKKIYYHFDEQIFNSIIRLEHLLNSPWTIDASIESLANSFHKHLQHSGMGISEHALLIKEHDKSCAIKEWLEVDIYLDRIRSAHNIGNILRTTEAFRLGRVLFGTEMANSAHPQVVKTSMGTSALVQTKQIESLQEIEKRPLIAVETHQNAVMLHDFVFPKSFTLVMGNEEFGVSSKILEKCDHIVEVPLCGQKNSLNVAACFSILAYKINLDLRS